MWPGRLRLVTPSDELESGWGDKSSCPLLDSSSVLGLPSDSLGEKTGEMTPRYGSVPASSAPGAGGDDGGDGRTLCFDTLWESFPE